MILNNLFVKNLPDVVPAELKAELRREFVLPAGITTEVRNAILDAYMIGIKTVFIFLVPVVGICFVIGLFLRVRPFFVAREPRLTRAHRMCP